MYRQPGISASTQGMPKPTGYKATREGVAARRARTRQKIWQEADVPPAWNERQYADKELMREMLKRLDEGQVSA